MDANRADRPGAEGVPSDARVLPVGEAGARAAGRAGAVPGKPVPWHLLEQWREYLGATAATLATLAILIALQAWLGDEATLVLFTVPIVFSAHRGGLGAGLM